MKLANALKAPFQKVIIISLCLLFSTWCLSCDCSVPVAHNCSSVVQVGFEEHGASIDASLKTHHCPFPCSSRPSGGRECAQLGACGFSRAGRQGLRRGCSGHSTLTSCPTGTVKGLYEAGYDFFAGWAWLMVFIFANTPRPWLHFLSMYNSIVCILIRPPAPAWLMSERWEGCWLHGPWDDAKRTRFICCWSRHPW